MRTAAAIKWVYKAAVLGNISTFGTYTVNPDGWVSYRIIGSSVPNWDGTDQKRMAEITGDQLKWMVPAASTANGESTVLILTRAKSRSIKPLLIFEGALVGVTGVTVTGSYGDSAFNLVRSR